MYLASITRYQPLVETLLTRPVEGPESACQCDSPSLSDAFYDLWYRRPCVQGDITYVHRVPPR